MQNYKKLITRMQEKMKKGQFIVGAGVDSPSLEKCCDQAGCDLILLYPTSRYTSAQNRFLAGYLAFGNTNNMMEEIAEDLIPLMNNSKLLCGLNGSDPFKNDRILLEHIRDIGFIGIHNYPAMTLVDGNFGMNLDNLKAGFDKEIEFFKKASEYGMFTCGMVRTTKQAIQLLRVNVDILIIYLSLGEGKEKDPILRQEKLEVNIRKLKEITEAIRKINDDIPILFYDESLSSVSEVEEVAKEVPAINGYYLLPITKKDTSFRHLEEKIKQLLII